MEKKLSIIYNTEPEELKGETRAVIYARYSSDAQSETSIEQQIKICEAYIKKCNYTLIKTYQDSALTATQTKNRPQFMEMIENGKQGKFDVCVALTLDRITREGDDEFKHLKRELKKGGAKFEFAAQAITNDLGGQIYEAILASKAEEDITTLRIHVNRGMEYNADFGYYNGGTLPPGFEKYSVGHVGGSKREKFRVRPIEKDKEFIRQAFEDYVMGKSTQEVAEYLNSNGVRTSKGTKLNRDSVLRMIENTLYKGVGTFTFKNEEKQETHILEGFCKPIVSEELWEKAQEAKGGRRYKGAQKKERVHYALKGKLYCGLCGSEMIADNSRSKNGCKYYYYTCKSKKRDSAENKCKKERVDKNKLEFAVMDLISHWVWREEAINEYIEAAKKAEKQKKVNPEIIKLQAEITKLKTKKISAMEQYLETNDSDWKDMYDEIVKDLNTKQAKLDAINLISNNNDSPDNFEKKIKKAGELWAEMQMTAKGREMIVKEYVDKITLYDPSPDDPDKFRIKLVFRPDKDSKLATEIESEVNLGVRQQLVEGHQTHITRTYFKSEIRSGYLFLYPAGFQNTPVLIFALNYVKIQGK
ncbi:MAG: recombinase family protein [Clostridia bacterium]|nr:recombinase family protein [Clostridia bacterium]